MTKSILEFLMKDAESEMKKQSECKIHIEAKIEQGAKEKWQ